MERSQENERQSIVHSDRDIRGRTDGGRSRAALCAKMYETKGDVEAKYAGGTYIPADINYVCVTGISSTQHHADQTNTSQIYIHDIDGVVKVTQ
jgi:hypothetical protein